MQQLFLKSQKKKKTKKSFLILILILVLLGFCVLVQFFMSYQSENGKEIIFNIERGESIGTISSNLKKEGLIRSEVLFKVIVVLKGEQGKLQAGVYSLSPSMSISEILNKISSGEIAKDKITIIEGWDLRDIGWHFENKGMFQAEELFELVGFPTQLGFPVQPGDFSQEFEFLKEKPKNVSLEGYFFPDTYEIKKGESLENIITMMLKNFDKKFTKELKEKIETQDKTLHEVLTMASLLEKEVKNYEERQIAAGILWKRLKNGWPLQVDATVNYVTGKRSIELTKDDLKTDSLYNTYKYYGLSPGPICNPGIDSIKASIFYKQSDFWYYLTKPDGKTEFSRTLEEHNIKRARYLK